MPGGDGTGPMGLGSMTGGARGVCAGFATPVNVNFGLGRGSFGGGRGRRNMYYATGLPRWARNNQARYPKYEPSKEDELSALKNQASYMNQNIEEINKRIKELEEQE